MKRKGKVAIVIGMIVLILVGPYVTIGIKSVINKDILTNLQGEIYYTKRDDDILTLYKSAANLENETLIYSHKNKGLIDFGDYNDNIIDFHYDKNTSEMSFRAMNNGDFSLFTMKEGQEPLENQEAAGKNDYIRSQQGNLTAIEKRGSIYIMEDGKEIGAKKFYGIYDDKFTGYGPIGFSPDGKYLIYSSKEYLTPLGSLAHNLISDFTSNVYIMDLDTGKSARFIDAYKIQWVMGN